MKFCDFEQVIGAARLSRYQSACAGNSRRAMTLYRKNLKLSQELFTIISCFEIALRNTIDKHFLRLRGCDWLRKEAEAGGLFDSSACRITKENINDAVQKLSYSYTHDKLVAELGFGFWRYMFAAHQFATTGRNLLAIFPCKPLSSPLMQYNHTYVFKQLAKINHLRNRVAHHEPVCFEPGRPVKSTMYVRQHYHLILQLFRWMDIQEATLLYGLDHVSLVCDEIDLL